jgi:hypothetical protein
MSLHTVNKSVKQCDATSWKLMMIFFNQMVDLLTVVNVAIIHHEHTSGTGIWIDERHLLWCIGLMTQNEYCEHITCSSRNLTNCSVLIGPSTILYVIIPSRIMVGMIE